MARSPHARHRALAIAVGAAALAATAGLAALPLFQRLELTTLDLRFALRGPIEQSPKIVHIDIDDGSIKRIGSWPFPRNVHADALEGLQAAGAERVVIDIEFLEPQRPFRDAEGTLINPDEELSFKLANLRTYLPVGFTEDVKLIPQENIVKTSSYEAATSPPAISAAGMVQPLEIFAQAASGFGCVDMEESDSDGIYRWVPAVYLHRGRTYFHLGVKVALDVLEAKNVRVEGGELRAETSRGPLAIPIDPRGRILLNWTVTGPDAFNKSFTHLPISDALISSRRSSRGGREDVDIRTLADLVSGKICVIGSSARAAMDIKPAPNSPIMPGVAVHSHMINMILTGRFLRPAGSGLAVAVFVLLGAGAVAASALVRPLVVTAVILLLLAVWWVVALLAFNGGTVMPMVPPSLAILVPFLAVLSVRQATEEKMRREIRSKFELFLDQSIVQEILQNPDVIKAEGQRVAASVMFTDIEGFSTFAERTPPEVVVKILNSYLTDVTDAVKSYQGYLDKYLGDGTMAIFGLRPGLAPAEAALNACQAAREIQKRIKARAHTFPFGRTRIGVASGEIVAGYIGGVEKKLNYTGVGDVVNVASRLQALNKDLGTEILIDERTQKLLPPDWGTKERGAQAIRGRQEAVKVFEI